MTNQFKFNWVQVKIKFKLTRRLGGRRWRFWKLLLVSKHPRQEQLNETNKQSTDKQTKVKLNDTRLCNISNSCFYCTRFHAHCQSVMSRVRASNLPKWPRIMSMTVQIIQVWAMTNYMPRPALLARFSALFCCGSPCFAVMSPLKAPTSKSMRKLPFELVTFQIDNVA